MEQDTTSYSNSSDYILKTQSKFNYAFYYRNFCPGLNREQVQDKLKDDLEDALFDISASDPNTTKWVNEQIKFNIPIANTAEVNDFWIIQNEINSFSDEKLNQSNRKTLLSRQQQQNLHQTLKIVIDSQRNTDTSIKETSKNVVEADKKIIFDGRSVASILKSYGNKQFPIFGSLDKAEQRIVAYCLNGILDLTNDSPNGQRKLFSEEQWQYLKQEFESKRLKHLPHLKSSELEMIRKIAKYLKKGKFEKAYDTSLLATIQSNKERKYIFKMISHIINAYDEREEIFLDADSNTEFDYMAKLWIELLQLLMGKDIAKINWGESVNKLTTEMKQTNNDNKSNTIGFKVDARFVQKVAKVDKLEKKDYEVDIVNIEAAKSAEVDDKVHDDKLKLAVETKVMLDNVVPSLAGKTPNMFSLQNFQICGVMAELCSLCLADKGLYVHVLDYDLSLPKTPYEFADSLDYWLRKLMVFRKACQDTLKLLSTSIGVAQRTFNDCFYRDFLLDQEQEGCNGNWVRGSFYMPTKRDPIPHFPKNFLSPPMSQLAHVMNYRQGPLSMYARSMSNRDSPSSSSSGISSCSGSSFNHGSSSSSSLKPSTGNSRANSCISEAKAAAKSRYGAGSYNSETSVNLCDTPSLKTTNKGTVAGSLGASENSDSGLSDSSESSKKSSRKNKRKQPNEDKNVKGKEADKPSGRKKHRH